MSFMLSEKLPENRLSAGKSLHDAAEATENNEEENAEKKPARRRTTRARAAKAEETNEAAE